MTRQFRAVVGLNFPHPDATGEEIRVEAGDEFAADQLAPAAAAAWLADGTIVAVETQEQE